MFKMTAALSDTIVQWESKKLSNEGIKPFITGNNSISSKLKWMDNSGLREEFKEAAKKRSKITFAPKML